MQIIPEILTGSIPVTDSQFFLSVCHRLARIRNHNDTQIIVEMFIVSIRLLMKDRCVYQENYQHVLVLLVDLTFKDDDVDNDRSLDGLIMLLVKTNKDDCDDDNDRTLFIYRNRLMRHGLTVPVLLVKTNNEDDFHDGRNTRDHNFYTYVTRDESRNAQTCFSAFRKD
ncbi:hypothetical protein TrispH2_004828 [Trichoplax sp. H2]|nr:hypothetical protein TrispH2_004828 [Trichoplax sp. H2]|eukprot:RDD42654.1 hypothetical protein TrispH2_004828 [Trichoplax sp. H2]